MDAIDILETNRLRLRGFTGDDWRDLYEYLSQESVIEYEPYTTFTKEMCKNEAVKRSQQEAFWAVCLKSNQKLIGNLYFNQTSPKEIRTWEIGYVFNPAFHGNGYATESCKRLIEYGFNELNAHRVIAMCNPENTASWRLLERLGMRREGHLRRNIFFDLDQNNRPIWQDTFEYGILREEWC